MFDQTSQTYPYFSNGLIYLPEASMEVLMRAGLPIDVTSWIRRGMMLADSQRCDEIVSTIDSFMATLTIKLSSRTAY